MTITKNIIPTRKKTNLPINTITTTLLKRRALPP
jgi:hypothetical protein